MPSGEHGAPYLVDVAHGWVGWPALRMYACARITHAGSLPSAIVRAPKLLFVLIAHHRLAHPSDGKGVRAPRAMGRSRLRYDRIGEQITRVRG